MKHLIFKVYTAGKEKSVVAACADPTDAAAVVGPYGTGATIRIRKNGKPLWTEGVDGFAGESYDTVGETVWSRMGETK